MSRTTSKIDNSIRYAHLAGIKLLAFALLFFCTGVITIIKFDSYFTDFWKIRNCDIGGYARGEFMAECEGIKIDSYNFGSVYLEIETEAVKKAQTADLLILGNSRTERSFSTDAIKNLFCSQKHQLHGHGRRGCTFSLCLILPLKN